MSTTDLMNSETPKRRIKLLSVSKHSMLDLMAGVLRLRLPEEATLVDTFYDWESDCFLMKVAHESYSEVQFSCRPPICEALLEIADYRDKALEEAAVAFEAEADLWKELEKRGLLDPIKRQGAKAIRSLKGTKPA